MGAEFRELDRRCSEMGELILRRRRSPSLGGAWVHEVTLDGAFLMSSAVDYSERALADLALEAFGEGPCAVLVGGLGLGHTAAAALDHGRVRRVEVVERLGAVIRWHREGLVPAAEQLMGDRRCALVHDDFFRRVGEPAAEGARYELILLDIDHSPSAWLDEVHGRFYSEAGLARLAGHLRPGGVFALWSADPVGSEVLDRLRRRFAEVREHRVAYRHPMLHREECDTVVVARGPGGD